MTRAQKSAEIEFLTSEFTSASSVVACDYKGLTVRKLEELRRNALAVEAKVRVVKNTLANIALKNADKGVLELSDTNVLIWGEDTIATTKVVCKFADENKEKFVIKAGVIDNEAADVNKIVAFSKLPGREELLGMLASVWMGPVRNFTIGLNNLREKKEQESAE